MSPFAASTPTTKLLPQLDRRSAVRAVAWSVPVVTLAAAAPAFASSTTMGCTNLAGAKRIEWTVTPQEGLAAWDAQYTGWHPMPSDVPEAERRYYATGAYVSAGEEAFTSGGDNGIPDVAAVVTALYAFQVSGTADLTVSTNVTVGFGAGTPNVERQDVVIDVVDGATVTNVARVTTKRKQVEDWGTNALPWGSNPNIHKSDQEMVALGYTLQNPYSEGTRPYTSDLIHSEGGTNRTIFVRCTFTLHALPVVRLDASGNINQGYWVNDDITVSRPQITVNC